MNAQGLYRLDERAVFLSGAAGHLGREMALALGHAGATLILNRRNLPRREALAAELGGPVLFLASRASSFVTGAVLTTDGGWTAW